MDYTYINYDVTDFHHDYFMMWDDPAYRNGNQKKCGAQCTQHKLYVKSHIKQKVSVGAHVYRYQTYPDAGGQCPAYPKDA